MDDHSDLMSIETSIIASGSIHPTTTITTTSTTTSTNTTAGSTPKNLFPKYNEYYKKGIMKEK
jgi:hypothetical protein